MDSERGRRGKGGGEGSGGEGKGRRGGQGGVLSGEGEREVKRSVEIGGLTSGKVLFSDIHLSKIG